MPARLCRWFALVVLMVVAGVAVAARQFGDVVVVEAAAEDVYAAGRTVAVAGAVAGDVVAAARSINTRERIAGDASLAGGNVAIGAVLTVADLGLRVVAQPHAPRGLYVLALVMAVVALGVVGLVPYVGPLALFLLFVLGNGAVAIRVWRGLRGQARP